MAQVLPAERDLRRVIGDGAEIPDGEVEGLDEKGMLDLYRSLILLRTYDERSVVYHRQGRIGTYAIFWNHEAMQAGSAHDLDRLVVRCDRPLPLQVDGEDAGDVTEAVYEAEQNAITVLV